MAPPRDAAGYDADELLGFVRCVMPHLLALVEFPSHDASHEALREQYSHARVRFVRALGSHLTVEFALPDGVPRAGSEDVTTEPVRVVLHPSCEAACTLFVRRGAIHALEADTKGSPWPARPIVVAVHEKSATAEAQHRGNNALAGLVSNLEYACGLIAAERDDAPLLASDEPGDRRGLRLSLRYSLASARDLLALLRGR